MNKFLSKNWLAKLLSLLVAAAIWFLIKAHLSEQTPRPQEPVPQAPAKPAAKPKKR